MSHDWNNQLRKHKIEWSKARISQNSPKTYKFPLKIIIKSCYWHCFYLDSSWRTVNVQIMLLISWSWSVNHCNAFVNFTTIKKLIVSFSREWSAIGCRSTKEWCKKYRCQIRSISRRALSSNGLRVTHRFSSALSWATGKILLRVRTSKHNSSALSKLNKLWGIFHSRLLKISPKMIQFLVIEVRLAGFRLVLFHDSKVFILSIYQFLRLTEEDDSKKRRIGSLHSDWR